MRGIHDDESIVVEGIVVSDTDRLAVSHVVTSISPHDRLSIANRDEVLTPRSGGIDVLNIALGLYHE